MFWFNYDYITSSDIINNIKLLIHFSIIDIAIISWLIVLVIIMIFYLVPILNIYIQFLDKKIKDNSKKENLRKILLQKEIEESIAKELNIK